MSTRLLPFLVVVAACSHKHAVTPVADHPAPAPIAAVTPPPAAPAAVSPHLAVDDDLTAQCHLQLETPAEAPKFAFDEFSLLPADRTVLDQVATCMTRGPLKGKTLHLVGRADPRGTDEYNLGLGDRRAEAVSAYLARLGVPAAQLVATTRGELDAKGTDDAGWELDRRVDLQVR